jgi:hypothetical protein
MDLRLDPSTNDLALTAGSPTLVSGAGAIAQQLRIRMKFFLGEWFLDTRLGIPYFQKILGKKRRKNLIDSIFRKAISTTPGVKTIDSFEQTFDGATRTLLLSFTVTTQADEVIIFNKEEFII